MIFFLKRKSYFYIKILVSDKSTCIDYLNRLHSTSTFEILILGFATENDRVIFVLIFIKLNSNILMRDNQTSNVYVKTEGLHVDITIVSNNFSCKPHVKHCNVVQDR